MSENTITMENQQQDDQPQDNNESIPKPGDEILAEKVKQIQISANSTSSVTLVNSSMQNSSLQALSIYASDQDDDDDDDSQLEDDIYVCSSSSSSSSSSESSEDEDISDVSTPKNSAGAIKKNNNHSKEKTYDSELEELPPVPDLSALSLNTDHEKVVHMGNVFGIVDKLVTVAALPNKPAYDLDTLLFLDNGKVPLGFVFDVMGQVSQPIYAIRFNSVEEIRKLNVEIGAKVYLAPNSKHTQYVFLQQLLKMRGSDASWMGDQEVPQEFQDFSDDEAEMFQRHGNRRLQPHTKRCAVTAAADDKHKRFEDTMNRKNTLNTKLNRYMDHYKGRPVVLPANFDPSVPPPAFRAAPVSQPSSSHQPQ